MENIIIGAAMLLAGYWQERALQASTCAHLLTAELTSKEQEILNGLVQPNTSSC